MLQVETADDRRRLFLDDAEVTSHREQLGEVRCYWKEGINVGASGELCHYPAPEVTCAVLSNMENGAWEPIKTIDRLVTAATSP